MCGLVIEHEGETVLSVRGDNDDPLSQGHICPKGVALQDIHSDPDRLRRPMRRDGSSWREIDWEDAYDIVIRQLQHVQREHGRDAVAVYLGNPTAHSLGALLFAPPFIRALRTRNRFSATSVDQLPHHLAAALMFGHGFLLPVPDLDRTDFFLVLGANPAASNGSLMSAGDVKKRMRAIRSRGGTLVVVDPRRTESAALADTHLFIRPGTDAYFLLAMLHVVFEEQLVRLGRIEPCIRNLSSIAEVAATWSPERVAAVVGIEAGAVRQLARDFAKSERAVCYGRIGVSTQEFGALCAWLINVLNAVTGHLDTYGGAMFPEPAVEIMRGKGGGRMGRWKSRVRSLPEFMGELPAAALAEEIDTPGKGQVRALVTHAGNPVLSTPNGARLDAALAKLDFYVAIDFYVNATTRHAHVILPPTGPLERDHYDLVFHALAVRNTAKYSPPMVPRAESARYEWEIFAALTRRLGSRRLRDRVVNAALGRLGARGVLDLALRFGPFGAGINPFERGLSVRRLIKSPHGEDLGALQPVFPNRLRTADRAIDLAPGEFVRDVARLSERFDSLGVAHAAPSQTLALIGRRALRSNNSWMHNSERLVRGKDRCTLLIHPVDAEARSLANGDIAHVQSRVGEVNVVVEVTDAMMPGVVSLPHGWGHGRAGVQLSIAKRHPGVSINDLTDELRLDHLSGNAAFSGVDVIVERAAVAHSRARIVSTDAPSH